MRKRQERPALLDTVTVQRRLAELPSWGLAGNCIERTFRFADFRAAIAFVNRIAESAEELDHHPDLDVRWNKVRVSVTTHSAGGLTEMDFALAERADRLEA